MYLLIVFKKNICKYYAYSTSIKKSTNLDF